MKLTDDSYAKNRVAFSVFFFFFLFVVRNEMHVHIYRMHSIDNTSWSAIHRVIVELISNLNCHRHHCRLLTTYCRNNSKLNYKKPFATKFMIVCGNGFCLYVCERERILGEMHLDHILLKCQRKHVSRENLDKIGELYQRKRTTKFPLFIAGTTDLI